MAKENQTDFNLKNPYEWAYNPMKETDFSKEGFLEGYAKSKNLESALNEIRKDPQSPDAYNVAGGILYSDPNFYHQINRSPRFALEDIVPEAKKGLEKYVSHNESEILSNFESDDYKSLVSSLRVPLEKAKEDGDYKTISTVINDYKALANASENVESKGVYVSEKMKSAPKYIKNEFERYSSNDSFINQIFKNYAFYAQENFKEVMEKGDMEMVFKTSLYSTKKKGEYYSLMADALYGKLNEKKK